MVKREANVEIMRLVLLLMVITIHVVAPYRMSRFDKFEFNWQFASALASLSRICTNTFVLISGYFYMTHQEHRTQKTLIRLLGPLLLYIPFFLFLETDRSFGAALGHVMISVFTNDNNFYHLWFVHNFLVLSLLAPFLVIALERASQRTHLVFMWLLLGVSSGLPTFVYLTGLYWFDLTSFDAPLLLFIALFVTGAYVRNYPPNMRQITAGALLVLTHIAVLFGNIWYNTRYSPLNFIALWRGQISSFEEGAWIEIWGFSAAFADPVNAVIVAASVLMLVFFTRLDVRSPVLGAVGVAAARHVYGAYINHVFWIEAFSRIQGGRFNLFADYWLDNPSYPLFIIVFILIVTVSSLLTDMLLMLIIARLRPLINIYGRRRSSKRRTPQRGRRGRYSPYD